MGGNFLGGAVALLYFLMFQLCGVTLAACFLNKERRYTQMILGSAAGSVLLMWLPSLWAFLFSFSITAHVLALISLLMLTVGAVFLKRPKLLPNDFPGKRKAFYRAERTLLLPLGLWLLFVFLVLHSFRYQNGETMHLRRHEYAPRVHHEYRGTEDISTHVFHFAGREAFVSVLVGQHFFKPIFARCAAALCVCAADAFCRGAGVFRRTSFLATLAA